MNHYKNGAVLSHDRMVRATAEEIKIMHTKCMGPDDMITSLSGGNQQKVLLGKWVRDDAKILMFDEPTHGVDIHAKQEIYSIIRNAAKNGAGVIVVSSELDELIELSDRIIMINNGQIVGEKTQKPFNDQEILSAIS